MTRNDIRNENRAAAHRWPLIVLTISVLWMPIAAMAAESAKDQSAIPNTVSAAVAQPLKAAKQAIRNKHWSTALDRIKAAQAVTTHSVRDDYSIDELLAYVLYRQHRYKQSADVYERLIGSPLVNAAQREQRSEAVALMYYRVGDYAKAAHWAKQVLTTRPHETTMLGLLGESYFRMNDYKSAADVMKRAVRDAERAHRVPQENWLRVIDTSYYRLGDVPGMKSSLLDLVKYYQDAADWRSLLDLYSEDVQDPKVAYGFRRLQFDMHLLKRPDDVEDLVFDCFDAGVPWEALTVLDRAKAEHLFEGAEGLLPDTYERLLNVVRRHVRKAQPGFDRLESMADKKRSAHDEVLLGEIYASRGSYEAAIAALQSALKRDDLGKGHQADVDAARVELGIAYFHHGEDARARHEFAKVDDQSKWADLARLWALRVGYKGAEHSD